MTEAGPSSEPDPESEPVDSAPTRRRRVVKWTVLGLLATWLVVVVFLGFRARSAMLDGTDHMESARAELTVGSLVRGEQLDELEAAAADFETAADASNSWVWAPLRIVPWLGRQVSSVQSLTSAASELADLGVDASRRMTASIGDQGIEPAARAEIASEIAATAEQVSDQMTDIDLGPERDLVGPLQRARDRLGRATRKLHDTLDDVAAGGAGVVEFLDGPSRYLLLAAHNGEMRAGSGMFLSAGVLTVTDGRFDVGEMSSTADLRLPPGAVTLPPDLDRLWGWTAPGEEWRNLAMSPDFPTTAALAADMWTARTGEAVDGVMVMDIAALKGLVGVVGSVDLPDGTLTPDTVTDFVMVEQYRDVRFGDDLDESTSLRRDRLSELARSVVGELDDNQWELTTLIDEMQQAIRGRHILMWSNHPDEQAAWKAAGATGEISSDSLMVALISQGGTKVDRWIAVEPTITRTPSETAGMDHVTVDVALRNDTPTGLPAYVAGPSTRWNPNAGVAEGGYAGIVSFTVPGDARDVALVGDPPLVSGPDGPTQVIARRVALARGDATTVTVQFELPTGAPVEILPSAKLPTNRWKVDGTDLYETTATVMPSE